MFPRLIQAYLSRSLVTMERVTIESMKFDNRVLRSLPVDKDKDNYCRTVQGMYAYIYHFNAAGGSQERQPNQVIRHCQAIVLIKMAGINH